MTSDPSSLFRPILHSYTARLGNKYLSIYLTESIQHATACCLVPHPLPVSSAPPPDKMTKPGTRELGREQLGDFRLKIPGPMLRLATTRAGRWFVCCDLRYALA